MPLFFSVTLCSKYIRSNDAGRHPIRQSGGSARHPTGDEGDGDRRGQRVLLQLLGAGFCLDDEHGDPSRTLASSPHKNPVPSYRENPNPDPATPPPYDNPRFLEKSEMANNFLVSFFFGTPYVTLSHIWPLLGWKDRGVGRIMKEGVAGVLSVEKQTEEKICKFWFRLTTCQSNSGCYVWSKLLSGWIRFLPTAMISCSKWCPANTAKMEAKGGPGHCLAGRELRGEPCNKSELRPRTPSQG